MLPDVAKQHSLHAVFGYPDLGATYATAARTLRTKGILGASPALKIWSATAQPGNDDHLLGRTTVSYVPRQDGLAYRRTLDAAIASAPDILLVTTWNEWWENTEIEPGQRYGDQYLHITKEYVRRWRATW